MSYLLLGKGVKMSGVRITIRLNEVEDDEVRDFMARHPEFRSVSELFRKAVMEYIKMADRGMLKNTGVKVDIEDRLLSVLEEYVEFRYFRDISDLITFVLRTTAANGELARILKSYIAGLNSLRLSPDERSAYKKPVPE